MERMHGDVKVKLLVYTTKGSSFDISCEITGFDAMGCCKGGPLRATRVAVENDDGTGRGGTKGAAFGIT